MEEEFGKLDLELKMDVKKEYELLASGLYECRYVGTSKRETREVNKEGEEELREYFRHKWEVVETGKWLFENSSTTLSAKSRLGEMVKALGIETKPNQSLNLGDLMGRKCQLYVESETKDGKVYNIIKAHIPLKTRTEAIAAEVMKTKKDIMTEPIRAAV